MKVSNNLLIITNTSRENHYTLCSWNVF